MDNEIFVKMLKMVASENDTDALLGLRGLQGLFAEQGVDFSGVLKYAASHIGDIKALHPKAAAAPVEKKDAGPVTISGMPQTRAPRPGVVELIPPGQTTGTLIQVQGAAVDTVEVIAFSMKDALVAAVLNKTRFKLKVVDVKNPRGDVIETVLQAEYEREGMAPVRIWANLRGEVAALATVMRQGLKTAFPELAG